MIKLPSNATTVALSASLVAKSTPGVLFSITGYNDSATSQYIQVHDAASLPANGAVPILIFYVTPKSNFSFDAPGLGRPFLNGIVVCNSSTVATKTLGSANCWFDVQYS